MDASAPLPAECVSAQTLCHAILANYSADHAQTTAVRLVRQSVRLQKAHDCVTNSGRVTELVTMRVAPTFDRQRGIC